MTAQVYAPMRLWTQSARRGTNIDRSEFSKLLRIYLYLRVHVEVPPEEVKMKYAHLRTAAVAWFDAEMGDSPADFESMFERAVEVSQRQH